MAELDEMVTKMVFEVYGVERLYESHMASTTYLLRCFKYRTRQLNETDMGIHPHKDKTFTSILHQNEINGLQIKTKDGQWIDVEPSPSTFLVMAGDAFMVSQSLSFIVFGMSHVDQMKFFYSHFIKELEIFLPLSQFYYSHFH